MGLALAGLTAAAVAGDVGAGPAPSFASRKVAFSELHGWGEDDHLAAFQAFTVTCRASVDGTPPLRAGAPAPAGLEKSCRDALEHPARTAAEARAFFEAQFQAVEIVTDRGGFLTGYYEPEVEGSLVRTNAFAAPLRARPSALVTFAPGGGADGLDPALQAALRTPDGRLAPAPDRAAILAGALDAEARPLVWLRDDVEVFLVQVQGSVRVRLPGGALQRYAYAGRNGYPYASVGQIILAEGHVPQAELTLARLKAFLREDAAQGSRIMGMNRSYVFFQDAPALTDAEGPIGGAGAPLTPWRSIAVDRTIWPYGLPVWMETTLPGGERFHRLTIAQDTGSAIVGPARADLFHGSGEEAGRRAGDLRHPMRFVVLLPAP